MNIPKVLAQFQGRFRTDRDCENFFYQLRWPEGFVCPKCGATKCWEIKQPLGYECAGCTRRISLTSGSLLAQTHLPLREWFGSAYIFCSQRSGVSARKLQEIIGLGSYQTAWLTLKRLRHAAGLIPAPKLSGTVYCFYFWYKEGREAGRNKAGRTTRPKTSRCIPVVCLHQPFHGRAEGELKRRRWLFFKVLPRLDCLRVGEFLAEHVHPDAALMVEDEQKAFFEIPTVRSVQLVDLQQRLEIRALLRRLRTWLNSVHGGIQEKYLQDYLSEFTFHINFPGTLDERVDCLMRIAATKGRVLQPGCVKTPDIAGIEEVRRVAGG